MPDLGAREYAPPAAQPFATPGVTDTSVGPVTPPSDPRRLECADRRECGDVSTDTLGQQTSAHSWEELPRQLARMRRNEDDDRAMEETQSEALMAAHR